MFRCCKMILLSSRPHRRSGYYWSLRLLFFPHNLFIRVQHGIQKTPKLQAGSQLRLELLRKDGEKAHSSFSVPRISTYGKGRIYLESSILRVNFKFSYSPQSSSLILANERSLRILKNITRKTKREDKHGFTQKELSLVQW